MINRLIKYYRITKVIINKKYRFLIFYNWEILIPLWEMKQKLGIAYYLKFNS